MEPIVPFRLLITVVEVAATMAFALSGFAAGARKRLDVVGLFAVAFLAAFGGGTLRDVLLDRRPFFWVEHVEYIWLIFFMSFAAVPLLRRRGVDFGRRAIEMTDAVGLGLFSIVGTSQALEMQLPAFVAVMMGVITGIFGGVMRDVVCGELPAVFHDRRPYAICAFAGGWVYLGLDALQLAPLLSFLAGIVVVTGLRMAALVTGWRVPGWPEDRP